MTGRPLGLYRLAAHLRQQGYTAKCLIAWSELPDLAWNALAKHHIGADTKIVAISATVMFRDMADGERLFFGITDQTFHDRCEFIKRLAPGCLIVVGGAQIAYAASHWLKRFSAVDYFVSGQGETILTHIVSSHVNGVKPKLPDITRPYVVSDQSMPYHDFATSTTPFLPEDVVFPREPLPLELGRGCIFKCSYCSYDLNGKEPKDFVRQVQEVKQDLMQNYERFGTRSYYLADDLINESDYKINIIHEVAQSLPFALHLQGFIRLDLIRRFPKQFQKLLDSGLMAAFFGIETVNDLSGKSVGKGLGRARVQEGLDIISGYCGSNFIGQAGMILGLPHDGPDTKYQLLEWAQDPDVCRVIKRVSVQGLSISTQHGQSEIDRDPASFGYQVLDQAAQTRRLSTDAWRTDIYDSESAMLDSQWVMSQLDSKRPWNRAVDTWNLPWVLWLDADNQQMILQKLRAQDHDRTAFDSWYRRVHDMDRKWHLQYLKSLHFQGF